MSNLKKKRNDRNSAGYRPLAIAALVASGILQPLLPVLAAGTAAGQTISNTATATYDDDNNAANGVFNATSNEVKIDVAPVSGLTVKPTGITDTDNGAVEQGDTLEYNFEIKNVGNIASPIFIPKPTVTNFTVTTVEYSYTDATNTVITGTIDITNGGSLPSNLPADGTVKVKVTGTVPTTGVVAGDPITVQLGNTGSNDNSPATQNVVDGADGSNADEVRTTFVPGGANPADNKEASATQSIPFATKVTDQAFSLIKKTATRTTGATAAANDDIITYNLNFSVLDTSPNGTLTAAALEGTPIRLDAADATKILVSDAVPEGTVLNAPLPVVSDWTAVYSNDSVASTIPVKATGGTSAEWTTTIVGPLSGVKRVGYVLTNAASITAGSAAVDFKIEVISSGLSTAGGRIYNIAQVFGETVGDPENKVVLDESGDNTPSNAGSDGKPLPFNPLTDTGKADPSTQGVDPDGNNSGTGDKGEANEIIIGPFSPSTDSILNGPKNQPAAVGPNDVNDDFTNASTPITSGLDPADPIASALVGNFTNTVKNPGTVALADVTVQPISPAKANTADNNGTNSTAPYLGTATIPTGTLVKLTPPTGSTQLPVVYKFDGADFIIEPAVAGSTQGIPLNFGSLAPNAEVTYTTEVTLPTGTVTPLTAIAIPLVAFVDDDPTGSSKGFTNELTNNITIDRVYTGYMKLFKEARILSANKVVLQDWTDATVTGGTGGLLSTKALSGQFIEYRISYQNISTPASGFGNVILNANNFRLVEDGVPIVGNTNNWADFTTHQQNTSANTGTTVNYFDGVTALGIADPADGNAVTKYENVVTIVTPGSEGKFQFRRLVN